MITPDIAKKINELSQQLKAVVRERNHLASNQQPSSIGLNFSASYVLLTEECGLETLRTVLLQELDKKIVNLQQQLQQLLA